jgi:hypothetical protein
MAKSAEPKRSKPAAVAKPPERTPPELAAAREEEAALVARLTKPAIPDELLPVEDDPGWVLILAVHKRLTERTGDARLAALDLQQALEQDRLPCMLRLYCNGARSLVLPLAWGRLIMLWLDQEGIWHVFHRAGRFTGRAIAVPVNYGAFFVWQPNVIRQWPDLWPAAPPYKLPPPGAKIIAKVIIDAIVDHDLGSFYPPPGGVPPNADRALLRERCEPFWSAACAAHGVEINLPTWVTFDRYVKGRATS